ncbi:MAG: radical SAM protein [Clostridium sartagoforme]|nr:radical SAM protein [Clostridium sartagoforme]
MGKNIPSKFNYIVKMDNGDSVIYNSLTKNIHKINEKSSDELEKFIIGELNEEMINQKLLNRLKENHYVVSDDKDELAIANLRYMENIMDAGLELTLLPTNRCNFRCPYCYEDHEDIKMSKELQDSIIKYVRKNIYKYTNVHISWFGGEPTEELGVMQYLSEEIMKICEKRYKQYRSGITTNAYNLDLETFEKLLLWKINHFHITIDGPKEIHDQQRFKTDGSGTFDKIIENLLNIKKHFKNRRFTMLIRTNVSNEVFQQLEKYLRFMSENFGDDDRFVFYFRTVNDWGGNSIDKFKGTLLGRKGNVEILKKIRELNIPLNYDIGTDILADQVCYAAKYNHYLIDSDGAIKKCTCDTNSKENIIGYMNNDGIMDLDDNKVAKWTKGPYQGKCIECSYMPNCFGRACPKQEAFGIVPKCSMFTHEIEEIIKVIYISDKYLNEINMEEV